MIIVCPACGRRYRVDPSRLLTGLRLRCTGCREIFESRPPDAMRHSEARPPAIAPRTSEAPPRPRPPSRTDPIAPPGDGPLVLIGDVNRPFRADAEQVLRTIGCRVETTEQGDAAFRFAVAHRPSMLVLNTRLPILSGSAVCEGVKGSPHLKGIKVVLVSSTVQPCEPHHAVRAGLEPDERLEDTIGAEELRSRLAALLGRSTPVSAPAVAKGASAPISSTMRAEQREALGPQAEIRRLARIMLSDLKLYNPDRFATAVQDGRLLETFRTELVRGKALITSRFPDLPDRMALLTAALREGIDEERSAAGAAS